MGIIVIPILSHTLQDLQHNNSGIGSISHNLDCFNSISECSIRVYLLSMLVAVDIKHLRKVMHKSWMGTRSGPPLATPLHDKSSSVASDLKPR